LELANLEGTPFQSGIPPHTNSIIPWNGNHIPFHLIPYHTIPFHLIPYHVIPYHHSKPVTGCLGSFSQNLKIISAGCNTGPWGSIFCGQVLQIFVVISSYKWRLYGECDPLKIKNQLNWALSQVLAIYTVDNPSQAT
jgi:hypothetical protein